MTFEQAMHWIAQGAINIDTGLERIEKDSNVHKAMHRLCALVNEGHVGALPAAADIFGARCIGGPE